MKSFLLRSFLLSLFVIFLAENGTAGVATLPDNATNTVSAQSSQASRIAKPGNGTEGIDFFDNFDSYTAGVQLVVQNPVDWQTWSGGSGGAEDPYVSNSQAYSGANSVVIAYLNDGVKSFGLLTSGVWRMSWQMHIPAGKAGYFNTLALFAGASSNWAMQAFFNAGGDGSLDAGGQSAAFFTYTQGAWILCEVICDLGNDEGKFVLEGDTVYTWQWTLGALGSGSPLQLDGNDFYGFTVGDEMYVDDYQISEIIPVVFPIIDVMPTSITESLDEGDSLDVTITVGNIGTADLDWSAAITSMAIRGTSGKLGRPVELSLNGGQSFRATNEVSATVSRQGVGGGTPPAEGGVALVLDDGTLEQNIGIGGGQWLWLNRFTPDPSEFPFNLETVDVWWNSLYASIGETYDIYVYEDTDGDGNPGTGAVHLGSLHGADVQLVEGFSSHSIGPVLLNGPGDVLVAVVNRTVGLDATDFPAAQDVTIDQNRSWAGAYSVGNPPDPPSLPADALWGEIGTFNNLHGNWMIRGAGTTTVGGPEWISLVGTTSGTITPGNSATFDVRLKGVLPESSGGDTTYLGTIEITSNDPGTPSVMIPVSLTVTAGSGNEFFDDFEAYTAGQQLVSQNNVDWMTWSGPPGTAEDPFVSDAQSVSGSNSVVIVNPNDLVRLHGQRTTGSWGIAWEMYIPAGNAGYFNTLSGFAPNPNYWAMECYFDAGGAGRLLTGSPAGQVTTNFTWLEDTWQHLDVIVDLDQDLAQLLLDGDIIHEWIWTMGASGGTGPLRLDATDLYGATTGDEMYIDDFHFKEDTLRVILSAEEPGVQIPQEFALEQNYPNPFNPSTRIVYALKEHSNVILKVYDVLGREIRTLVNGEQVAGLKEVVWDGRNESGTQVASGIYIYHLQANDFVRSMKMILMK